MKVALKHHTPLSVCINAIRSCWDSHGKGGCYPTPTDKISESDVKLIDRVVLKHRHSSTAEHLTYNFHISGVSRALLQEMARHRMASISVQSSRYTLSKYLKSDNSIQLNEKGIAPLSTTNLKIANKYIVMTGSPEVDTQSMIALANLQTIVRCGISNDIAKYCMPESFKTEFAWSVNARSLQNFLYLRTDKSALWEIRDLANMVYEALPSEHIYLFEEFIKDTE